MCACVRYTAFDLTFDAAILRTDVRNCNDCHRIFVQRHVSVNVVKVYHFNRLDCFEVGFRLEYFASQNRILSVENESAFENLSTS